MLPLNKYIDSFELKSLKSRQEETQKLLRIFEFLKQNRPLFQRDRFFLFNFMLLAHIKPAFITTTIATITEI